MRNRLALTGTMVYNFVPVMNEKATRKILLVDDDEHVLRLVSRFLEDHGFSVLTSSIPFVAPLIVKERPNLMVLDITMPLISGDRLMGVLKDKDFFAGIPVIFFSDTKKEDLLGFVKETGAAAFVRKSDGMGDLLREIRRVLSDDASQVV